MKRKLVSFILLSIILLVSLLGCKISPFSKNLPTYTPQATYTPRPTYTPNPTLTANPLPGESPHFDPLDGINMEDMAAVLSVNGFVYAGGTDYGGCSSTCEVYEQYDLDLSTSNYADGAFVISADVDPDQRNNEQEALVLKVIEEMFGTDLADWIREQYPSVYSGSEVTDTFDRFGVYIKLFDGNLLIISVSQ